MSNEMGRVIRKKVDVKSQKGSDKLTAKNISATSTLAEAKAETKFLVEKFCQQCQNATVTLTTPELVSISQAISDTFEDWPHWRYAVSLTLVDAEFPKISILYLEQSFNQIFTKKETSLNDNMFKVICNLLTTVGNFSKVVNLFYDEILAEFTICFKAFKVRNQEHRLLSGLDGVKVHICFLLELMFQDRLLEIKMLEVLISYMERFLTIEWSSSWETTIRQRFTEICVRSLYLLMFTIVEHKSDVNNFCERLKSICLSLYSMGDSSDLKFYGLLLNGRLVADYDVEVDRKFRNVDMLQLLIDRFATCLNSTELSLANWIIQHLTFLIASDEVRLSLTKLAQNLRGSLLRILDEFYPEFKAATLMQTIQLLEILGEENLKYSSAFLEAKPSLEKHGLELQVLLENVAKDFSTHQESVSKYLSINSIGKKVFTSWYSDDVKKAAIDTFEANCRIKLLTDVASDLIAKDYLGHFLYVETLYKLVEWLWRMSDFSEEIRKQIAEAGFVGVLIKELNDFDAVKNLKSARSKHFQFIIRVATSMLYSTSKSPQFVKRFYQDCKAAETLAYYLDGTLVDPEAVILCIAYCIVDTPEAAQMASERGILQKLVDRALYALSLEDRIAGYTVEELIDGLCLLATNDSTKLKLMDCQVIELIKQLIRAESDKPDRDISGKLRGIDLLWTISFEPSVRTKILANHQEDVMEPLRRLTGYSNENIQTAAKKTLTFIEKLAVADKTSSTPSSSKESSGGHVFLSYSWKQQETVLKLRDELNSRGHETWMDVDKMKGGLLDAMAEAVEQASVVLICFSQTYKESNPCRAEAQYAFSLGKPIIPLNMEYHYQADGWLGILVRPLKYIDLSLEKRTFEWAVSELLKTIQGTVKDSGKKVAAAKPLTTGTVYNENTKIAKYLTWSNAEVVSWLQSEEIDPSSIGDFAAMNGKQLGALLKMRARAPESYYTSVKEICFINERKHLVFLTVIDALERLADAK